MGKKQMVVGFIWWNRPGNDNLRLVDFGDKGSSDTSVSGWQFQALKAAYNTGAVFPDIEDALEASIKNFYRVYSNKNGVLGIKINPTQLNQTIN